MKCVERLKHIPLNAIYDGSVGGYFLNLFYTVNNQAGNSASTRFGLLMTTLVAKVGMLGQQCLRKRTLPAPPDAGLDQPLHPVPIDLEQPAQDLPEIKPALLRRLKNIENCLQVALSCLQIFTISYSVAMDYLIPSKYDHETSLVILLGSWTVVLTLDTVKEVVTASRVSSARGTPMLGGAALCLFIGTVGSNFKDTLALSLFGTGVLNIAAAASEVVASVLCASL